MLNPLYAAFLLAVEAQKVIELRRVQIAWGGAEGQAEKISIVGEKVVAAMKAANTLMGVAATATSSPASEHSLRTTSIA